MTNLTDSLRQSIYRLEGIADHVDRAECELGPRCFAYLRAYASMEDKELSVRTHGAEIIRSCREDRSELLFSITRLADGTVQARIFSDQNKWCTTGDSLHEVVCRLITLHQMSASGLDTDRLTAFLLMRQGE